MKLLCSFLILAGVFALNDASISYGEQMRVYKDQMKVAELKRMALNRDLSTVQCATDLLNALTEILGVYNNEIEGCNKTKLDEIEEHNAIARKKIELFSADTQNSCDSLNSCAQLDTPEGILICFESESSQSAKMLTSVSNEASVAKIDLKNGINSSISKEDSCKKRAYAEYSDKSDAASDEFDKCTNNKKGEKTTTTTKAPAPTPPTENGEPASRVGRPNRHGKLFEV